MLIKMLDNVRPVEYDMNGQPGWAEAVQFAKGSVYDMEESIAFCMIDGGDAELI